jgi:hypothetical protein
MATGFKESRNEITLGVNGSLFLASCGGCFERGGEAAGRTVISACDDETERE